MDCFLCNGTGHMRRHCPQNPNAQQPPPPPKPKAQGGNKKGGKRGGRKKANKRKGKGEEDQRDPKKPKLEGEREVRMPNPDSNRDKTPKRKIVLLFGYCGKNYIGLQR